MKKLILQITLFLFFSTHLLNAQDTLKTLAGQWTTELNINPLQGQISLNNAINQIKGRYFVSDQTALRLAFSFNNIKKNESDKNIYGTNPIDNSDVKKTTSLGLNFGFEHHLKGTRRLSPYIGAEIAFGLKYANEIIDTKESTTEFKGGWQTTQTLQYYNNNGYGYGYYTVTSTTEQGYTSFGINLITGFDYYIAKHFFVGYELLFGYNYIGYDNFERTVVPKVGQAGNNNNSYPTQSLNESNFGAKIINGIRLGYSF